MTKQRWIVLSVAAVILTAGAVILYFRQPVVKMNDGTVIQFGGVSYGTNNYIHGTLVEKSFARWIPDSGLKLGGIQLRKPRPIRLVDAHVGKPALWFYFQSAGDSGTSTISRLMHYRIIAISEDGTLFPNYFSGAVQRKGNELHARVPLKLYPRTEKKLRFRLETFTASNQWETLAEYAVPNPVQVANPKWEMGSMDLPQVRALDSVKLVLKGAFVTEPLAGKSNPELERYRPALMALGASSRMFALQLEVQPPEGRTLNAFDEWKRWEFRACSATDRFGNEFEFDSQILRPLGQIVNPFTMENPGQVLTNEPHQIKMTLQQMDHVAIKRGSVTFSNLTMHPGPSTSAREHWLTNAFGIPVCAKWSSDGLVVELAEDNNDALLLMAKVSCGEGVEPIEKPSSTGRRIIFNQTPGQTVNVQVNLVRLAHLEYFARPVLQTE